MWHDSGMPTIEAWLKGAVDDVTRSSQPDVRPVLEALALAAGALRRADWNSDASRDEARPRGGRHGTGPSWLGRLPSRSWRRRWPAGARHRGGHTPASPASTCSARQQRLHHGVEGRGPRSRARRMRRVRRGSGRPAARRADLAQGHHRRPRRADHGRLGHAARPRGGRRRCRGRAAARRRRRARRQDQSPRVRAQAHQRRLGLQPGAPPAR